MAFRKAKAEQAALKVGIYGPAGSGKTFTTLLAAEGLANTIGKRIAYIDTEHGTDFYAQEVPDRKVHPAAFDFDAVYTRSLTDVLREVKAIDQSVHGVVVLDSITHIWEAAIGAYGGKTTRANTIPLNAWGGIKKPYKELVNFLLSSSLHVFFLGRQGNEYEENDEGELKKSGVKMKAEGETPYEPHILIRMECHKKKDGNADFLAFAEKDRTGILAGRTIVNPNFATLVKPILSLLGGTQAKIQNEDETSQKDAEALAEQDRKRAEESERMRQKFSARIDLCETEGELKQVGKDLNADVKKQMLPGDVTELRGKYLTKERELKGQPPLGVPSDLEAQAAETFG